MRGLSIAPRRVFGVHVGTIRDDAHDIWVCRAHPGTDGVRVESIERLVDLPGGVSDAAGAAQALVGKIRDAPRSAWGFDAPFAAARSADVGTPSPVVLRETERQRGVSAPPAATAAWMRRRILAPLTEQTGVCVLPLQQAPMAAAGMPAAMLENAASTYLLEVAPIALVATLRAEGLDLDGRTEASRVAALRELSAHSQLRPIGRALRTRATTGEGSGLAAVYCAIAAWRGYRQYDHGALHLDERFAREGFIYC